MGKSNKKKKATDAAKPHATKPPKMKGKEKTKMAGNVTTSSNCWHRQPRVVVKIGKATIWAGDCDAYLNGEFDLIVDLADKVAPVDSFGLASYPIPAFLKNLLNVKAKPLNVLKVKWADFNAPHITKAQWEALAKDIREIDGNVLVQCMQGHGRTGTALACLIAACKPAEHPIDFVRKHYCKKALESNSQTDYVTGLWSEWEQRDGSNAVSGKSTTTTVYAGFTGVSAGSSKLVSDKSDTNLDLATGDYRAHKEYGYDPTQFQVWEKGFGNGTSYTKGRWRKPTEYECKLYQAELDEFYGLDVYGDEPKSSGGLNADFDAANKALTK